MRHCHFARFLPALGNTDVLACNPAIVVVLDHDRALRLLSGRWLSMFASSSLLRWIRAVASGRISVVQVSRDAHQHYCDEEQQAGAHARHVQTHAVISCSLIFSVGKQTAEVENLSPFIIEMDSYFLCKTHNYYKQFEIYIERILIT